jgi:uncharacterized integral membrane protein
MSSIAAVSRLLWAVIAIVLFFFALLAVNQGPVALRFLNWQTPELSVFWWLLAAFLLGVLSATLAYSMTTVRLRMRQRALTKQLDDSRREVQKLRGPQPQVE